MITIKTITSYFFLTFLFFSCKTIKTDLSENKITKQDCFKLYNQKQFDSISNFYDDRVEKSYSDFLKSDNNVDIILVQTSYGYDIKQEYFRLFSKNSTAFISTINYLEKELSMADLGEIIKFNNSNKKNLFINCPEKSSKSVKVEFLYKSNNNLIFTFNSNSKIEDISTDLSKDEMLFLKSYVSLFR
ncbi:hypothetical protein ACFSX9_01470 [Flavobacterium ardleyense]|uniref:Lipoprotein n=1 Tax=Flavobacterium ardleyense TaxID=2038737 RepID=A0ABW5Z3I4_9FLAO